MSSRIENTSNSKKLHLPQEVISYIFRFLSPVDVRSASLVCHLWAKASEDPLLWKQTIFILYTKNDAFSEYLVDSLKRRCIQHVSFRHIARSLQIVQVCKRLAGNLRTLSLKECRCVNETLIQIILKSCGNLTSINLGRCRQLDVSKKSSWLQKCASRVQNITTLDISCCKSLSDWTLAQIPLYFPKVKDLGLSGCKEVSLRTWIDLGTELTFLNTLDISRSDISDDILLNFTEVPSLYLISINVSACKQLTDNGIVSLVKNQTGLQYLKLSCLDITNTSILAIGKYLLHLKDLDLNSCRQITDQALQSSKGLLKKLRSINVYSCYQLTSKGFERFFSRTKEMSNTSYFPLKTLILNGCSLATDDMIDKCCRVLQNLQELDISSCLHITNSGLQSITTFLTELKVLKLSWCANITDAGLLGLTENNKKQSYSDLIQSSSGFGRLSKLCVLDISHCTGITDDDVQGIYTLQHLKSLNLNMCIEITDITLLGLANHMKALQSLSLNGCNSVTDTGVVAMAKALSHLNFLDVSKCDHITDLSIYTIAKYCKNLTHLDLSMCCQVTSHSVDELETSAPGLVSLQLRYSGANSVHKYL